jgi:hypothetical protein
MTKSRTRQEPTSPRRPRTPLLTPPGSVAREYETTLRRDFGIELSEFSDDELRAAAASHGLRQVLVRRILAGVRPVIAVARRLRSAPRLTLPVRTYDEAHREFMLRVGPLAPTTLHRRRSSTGLTRLDDEEIRRVAAAFIWTSLQADILWIYANSVVAEGRNVATSRELRNAIRSYDRVSQRQIASAHDRYNFTLRPRPDPRTKVKDTTTRARR